MINYEFSTQTRKNILLLAFLLFIFFVGNVINRTAVNLLLIAASLGLVSFLMLKEQVSDRYLIFWEFMVFLLVGYQFFAKGFANLELSPIFIGEVGLLLGGLAVLLTLKDNFSNYIALLKRPLPLFLIVFIIFHAIRILFDLSKYPVADVFRDSVIWAYAAFALIIYLLIPVKKINQFIKLYGKLIPYYLVVTLLLMPLVKIYEVEWLIPLSKFSIIKVRSDNVGFHLAGVVAYLLLIHPHKFTPLRWPMTLFIWTLWAVDWIVYGVNLRAGTFGALGGLILAMIWRPRRLWYIPLTIILVVYSLFWVSNIQIDYKVGDNVGAEDLNRADFTNNFLSMVDIAFGTDLSIDTESDEGLQVTVKWRVNWWEEIVNYTVNGDYFWQGKGYGVNLATDDGFAGPLQTERLNRYPHNISMSFLARSGVIGLGLWIGFLLIYIYHMLTKAIKYRSPNMIVESDIVAWLLIYWIVLLFVASLGVVIEGPMGGIWFWSLTGIGLAYTERENLADSE